MNGTALIGDIFHREKAHPLLKYVVSNAFEKEELYMGSGTHCRDTCRDVGRPLRNST